MDRRYRGVVVIDKRKKVRDKILWEIISNRVMNIVDR